jgi:hypothetical protein
LLHTNVICILLLHPSQDLSHNTINRQLEHHRNTRWILFTSMIVITLD